MDQPLGNYHHSFHHCGQLTSRKELLRLLEIRFAPLSMNTLKDHCSNSLNNGNWLTIKQNMKVFLTVPMIISLLPPQLLYFGIRARDSKGVTSVAASKQSQAIGLASLQEEKFLDKNSCAKSWIPKSNFVSLPYYKPLLHLLLVLLSILTIQKTFPNKRLTPSEMQFRCEKGLYFNCDENFTPDTSETKVHAFVNMMRTDFA